MQLRASCWAIPRAARLTIPVGLGALIACGGISPADDDGGTKTGADASPAPADAGEPDFALAPGAARVDARVTEVAAIEVSIDRRNGFAEPVVVSATDLPPGVTANDITISADRAGGTMQIDAGGGTPADLAEVTLVGTSGSLTRTATFEFFVIGAAGTPDESFGEGGRLELAFQAESSANMIGVADDSVVVGGVLTSPEAGDMFASKHLADGTPDPDFGDGGVAQVDLQSLGFDAQRARVVAQSDGSLILAGEVFVDDNNGDVVLARLTPGGQRDASFAGGGLARHPVGSVSINLSDVAVHADDRITVALEGRLTDEVIVATFTADGQIDDSFGTGGVRTIDLASDANPRPHVAAAAGGKILVVATQQMSQTGGQLPLIFRLLADGSDDPGFGGGDPKAFVGQGGAGDVLPRGGGAIAAGHFDNGSSDVAVLAQRAPDGSTAADFGDNGVLGAPDPDGGNSDLDTLLTRGDGKIVAVGTASAGLLVARTAGDALDAGFGDGGIGLFPLDAGFPVSSALSGPHRFVVLVQEFDGGAQYSLVRFWD